MNIYFQNYHCISICFNFSSWAAICFNKLFLLLKVASSDITAVILRGGGGGEGDTFLMLRTFLLGGAARLRGTSLRVANYLSKKKKIILCKHNRARMNTILHNSMCNNVSSANKEMLLIVTHTCSQSYKSQHIYEI